MTTVDTDTEKVITPPVDKEAVSTKSTPEIKPHVIYAEPIDSSLYFDQEDITDEDSYTNLGHSIDDKFDLKGKNRRMRRLKNKKKDKMRKDRYRD